jgi:hypothetical protein
MRLGPLLRRYVSVVERVESRVSRGADAFNFLSKTAFKPFPDHFDATIDCHSEIAGFQPEFISG